MYLFFSAYPLFSAPSPSSYHILQDMHTFSTNYPRQENSEAEENTFTYIEETLSALQIPMSRIELDSFDSFHSFSSILTADFEGSSEGEVYLIFPVNHPQNADREESGAAGLTLALTLCRSFSAVPPAKNVHILFMGAEIGRGRNQQLGSRAFLEDYFSTTPEIFLYIDLRRLPDQLDFRPYGTGIVSPAWLVKHAAGVLLEHRIPYSFSSLDFNIHQLGFNSRGTRLDPYFDREIPSLYLGSEIPAYADYSRDAPPLQIEGLQTFLIDFINSLPNQLPREWDRHYLFFKWENRTLIVSELSYVLILLFLFAAVLLYPFFQQKRFYRYLRSIRHNSWVLPIIFLLMFLYLLISTFVLEGISAYRNNPLLWQQEPLLMLVLKISFAVFLFSLSHRLTAAFHLGRLRGSFYSASGLFFLLINVMVLTSYNLSLTMYGALIFFLGFLFTVVRHRLLKSFYLFLSIILLLVLLVQTFRTGSSGVMYGVLLSHVQGNLIISFHLLPYMLFLLRLNVLFHHPRQRVRKRISFAFDLIFGILSTALILHFTLFYQLPQEVTDRLRFEEVLDSPKGTHQISISGSEIRESLDFEVWGNKTIQVEEGLGEDNFARIVLPLQEEILIPRVSSEKFLGRATYTLVLDAPSPPEKIEIGFQSSSKINLYDSDYPHMIAENRESVRFLIGRYPDYPFRMSFTIPRELAGTLNIRTEYYSPPYDFDARPGKYQIDYTFRTNFAVPLPLSGENPELTP